MGILSGIGAFLMGFRFPVWGFSFNRLISAGFSAFMVFAFVRAFQHVKARRFALHREWMIRGFATGLGVALFRVTMREFLPRLGMVEFDMQWNTVMAISFPITLGVAELWIRATRRRQAEAAPVSQAAPAPAIP